jgi:ketosteroid isomerase-like protein
MTDRDAIEKLIRDAYATRVRGDVEAAIRFFDPDIEVRDGRIISFVQFCDTALAANLMGT